LQQKWLAVQMSVCFFDELFDLWMELFRQRFGLLKGNVVRLYRLANVKRRILLVHKRLRSKRSRKYKSNPLSNRSLRSVGAQARKLANLTIE